MQTSDEHSGLDVHADGYAYRYGDGFIRFNHGSCVNGGDPIESIPYFLKPTVEKLLSSQQERINQLEAERDAALFAVLKEHEASCDQCSIHITDLKAGYVGKLSEKFCDRHADLQREREERVARG